MFDCFISQDYIFTTPENSSSFFCAVVDEASKKEIEAILVNYDRSLLVADPRITEPKKFGGPGQELVSRSLTVKTLWKIYVEGEICLFLF